MSILDDIEIIKRMDFNNNLDKLANLPKAIEELCSFSKKVDIRFRKELDNIYIMGDTDGRIAGYLLQTLLLYDIEISIIIEDTGSIPGFISEKTLVFVIFTSSQKDDVIEKINSCARRKAYIICITEEGINLDDIDQSKVKVLEIPAEFGYCFKNHYIFIAILHLLSKNSLVRNFYSDLDETIRVLKYLKGDYLLTVSLRSNPAKELAIDLYRTLIFFYSSCGTTDSIAKRWSLQLRKRHYLTECSTFPEADYEQPFLNIPNINLKKKIVFLRDKADDYRIIDKYTELKIISIENNIDVIELYGIGRSKLSKMISLNFLTDFVNNYLSFLEGTKSYNPA